jgi:hypothetical protein
MTLLRGLALCGALQLAGMPAPARAAIQAAYCSTAE